MTPSSKLYFKLGGGLGNQILQYAGARCLSEQQGSEAFFDITGLDNSHHGQKSLIINLDLQGIFSTSFVRRKFWKLLLRFSKNRPEIRKFIGIHVAKTLGYEDFENFPSSRVRYLEGFFISHRYILELRKSGRLGAVSPSRPTDWYLAQAEMLKRNVICGIHIRQGDYLDSWQHYGILNSSFYSDAILDLKKRVKIDEFWIFTDSPESARKMMQSFQFYNFNIVTQPQESNDAESLILLSLCDSLICANSTFSFCAALLSNAKEVIVPETFYRALEVPGDLYPAAWKKLESRWLDLDKGISE